jgi:hypothetical protein
MVTAARPSRPFAVSDTDPAWSGEGVAQISLLKEKAAVERKTLGPGYELEKVITLGRQNARPLTAQAVYLFIRQPSEYQCLEFGLTGQLLAKKRKKEVTVLSIGILLQGFV